MAVGEASGEPISPASGEATGEASGEAISSAHGVPSAFVAGVASCADTNASPPPARASVNATIAIQRAIHVLLRGVDRDFLHGTRWNSPTMGASRRIVMLMELV